jgi:signal transduction histidine kinase
MTVSYLVVTAAAVLVAEIVILAVVFPQALARADQSAQVRNTANMFVKEAISRLASGAKLPTTTEDLLAFRGFEPGRALDLKAAKELGQGIYLGDGSTVALKPIPGGALPDTEPVGFVLLLNADGSVRASSYPGRYPPGSRGAALPEQAVAGLRVGDEGSLDTPAGRALWASLPIIGLAPWARVGGGDTPDKAPETAPDKGPGKLPGDVPDKLSEILPRKGGVGVDGEPVAPTSKDGVVVKPGKDVVGKGQVVGAVYVQIPVGSARPPLLGAIGPALRQAGPALLTGLGLLLVTLPVGVVFGLLATRRLTRRVQRLAATTAKVAEGDLSLRLPVDGSDEVSQLERAFNRMAARLGMGISVERQLAGANARLAERARIARELHDAISQSLFSLGMLTGGLRRALPGGSPLAEQVKAMESTVTRMSQEMRALLLELRPVALEEAGLVPALEELCRVYESRLGVSVEADLSEVALPPPAEHAVLRLVQEALANAVKHGDPTTVRVRLAAEGGSVVVTVADDGCGFDPAASARRGMGLISMRDRVQELGGVFELVAGPGQGTTVRAVLPARSPLALGSDWAAFTDGGAGREGAWTT